MDLTLKAIAFDRGAAAILGIPNHHFGKPAPAVCLPKEILEIIGGAKSEDLSSLRTHFRVGDDEYSCRGFLLEFGSGSLSKPMALLYLERHASASVALYEVAARYKLTNREQEVLGGILTGLTSKELADRMKITPNTLKAFLRLIKIKMGVTTRGGMVGKLLDPNHGGHSSDVT